LRLVSNSKRRSRQHLLDENRAYISFRCHARRRICSMEPSPWPHPEARPPRPRVYTSAFWERLWRQRASSPFFASYLCFVVAYIVYGHPAGNWISRAGSGDGKCRIAPHMGSNALSGRNTIAWADRRSGGSGNIENARHNGDEDWTS